MDSVKAGSLVAWAQAASSLARMSAGVPLGATIPRSTANTTLIPSSLSVGIPGISGFRFSVAIAMNFSWPASTLPLWVRLPSVRSICPPRIAFIRGASPSYDTYLNLIPAAFSTRAGKKWLGEPGGAPTVICPGLALRSLRSSCHDVHLVFGLAVRIDGVDVMRQIGSESGAVTAGTPLQYVR